MLIFHAVSILSSTISKLNTVAWETEALHTLLYDEIARLNVKSKFYMTALRHALTGMKVYITHIYLPIPADVLHNL